MLDFGPMICYIRVSPNSAEQVCLFCAGSVACIGNRRLGTGFWGIGGSEVWVGTGVKERGVLRFYTFFRIFLSHSALRIRIVI